MPSIRYGQTQSVNAGELAALPSLRHLEHDLDRLPSARSKVGNDCSTVGERDDVGDQMVTHRCAMSMQHLQCRGDETIPVPRLCETARHTTDLRAPDHEAVVMELVAEAQSVGTALIEREIDDRGLSTYRSECRGQRRRLASTLERHVGATVTRPAAPALLDPPPAFAVGVIDARGAESFGGGSPNGRSVQHHDLRGAVMAGEQGSQEPDHTAADHEHALARHAVSEADDAVAALRRGVQEAVGADRAHLRDVDSEQRIEIADRVHRIATTVGDVVTLVAVGRSDDLPSGEA